MKLNLLCLTILIIINVDCLKLVDSNAMSKNKEINSLITRQFIAAEPYLNHLKRRSSKRTTRKDRGKMSIKWNDESSNRPMFAVFSLDQRQSSIYLHDSKKGTQILNTRKDYKHKPMCLCV